MFEKCTLHRCALAGTCCTERLYGCRASHHRLYDMCGWCRRLAMYDSEPANQTLHLLALCGCAGEKALIHAGEMSTWIPRTFGGDRIIQPPTTFNIQGYLKPNTTFNSTSFMPSALARPVPPTATQVCHLRPVLSYERWYGSCSTAMPLAVVMFNLHVKLHVHTFTACGMLCCTPTPVQDSKGHWWVCPDFGYDMVPCPNCEGPPMRCKSHYNLLFR